jgi:transposase
MRGVGPIGGRIRVRERRKFTPQFKARVVLDILTGIQSQAEACRKHGPGPNLVASWKAAFPERTHPSFGSESARSTGQARVAELEQILGRVTLENVFLKVPRAGPTHPR